FEACAREIAGKEIVERGAHETDAKVADGETGRYDIDQKERRQVADDFGRAYIGAGWKSAPCPLFLPIGIHVAQARILKGQERIDKKIEGRKPQWLRHGTLYFHALPDPGRRVSGAPSYRPNWGERQDTGSF